MTNHRRLCLFPTDPEIRHTVVTVEVNSRTGVVSAPGEREGPLMRKAVVKDWVASEPKVHEWANALAKKAKLKFVPCGVVILTLPFPPIHSARILAYTFIFSLSAMHPSNMTQRHSS